MLAVVITRTIGRLHANRANLTKQGEHPVTKQMIDMRPVVLWTIYDLHTPIGPDRYFFFDEQLRGTRCVGSDK